MPFLLTVFCVTETKVLEHTDAENFVLDIKHVY